MASAADLVYDDFISRIEGLSPTSRTCLKDFEFNQRPTTLSADQSSGMTRSFAVYWLGSREDDEPSDMAERWAQHDYRVEVAYSTDYDLDDLSKMVVSDRHDLIKELRHTVDSTKGLHGRVRIAEELDRGSPTTWYLRQTWRCDIREVE